MKEQTRNELKKMLDASDKRVQEEKQKKTEQIAVEDTFLKQFKAAAHEIIKPVVEELVNELQGRGHNLRFVYQDEHQNGKSGTNEANVRVHFTRAGSEASRSGGMDTAFTFFASRSSQKVRLHSSTTSQAGPCGDVSVKEVTPDLVEKELLKWLQLCL